MVMLKRFNKLAAMVLCAAGISGMADAQEMSDPAKDASVQDVLACRAFSNATERLVCFDAALPSLEEAFPGSAMSDAEIAEAQNRQQAQLEAAATASFGKSLNEVQQTEPKQSETVKKVEKPKKPKKLKKIASPVKRVIRDAAGMAIISLENGQVWYQRSGDKRSVSSKRALGKEAAITRKAMGSYTMRINKGKNIRVERLN